MSTNCWTWEKDRARLELPGLQASIDALRPSEGLGDVHYHAIPLPGVSLLGIDVRGLQGTQAILDRYATGMDLAVSYKALPHWPVQIDARWHALASEELPESSAGVDLIVSVRTELLDSRPETSIVSRLPACDVLRLIDPTSAGFDPIDLAGNRRLVLREPQTSCWLLRLAGAATYCEMLYSASLHGEEAAIEAASGRATIAHHLFPESLEKGVILRARLRGVVLPRAGDCEAAAACYRQFIALEPPLES